MTCACRGSCSCVCPFTYRYLFALLKLRSAPAGPAVGIRQEGAHWALEEIVRQRPLAERLSYLSEYESTCCRQVDVGKFMIIPRFRFGVAANATEGVVMKRTDSVGPGQLLVRQRGPRRLAPVEVETWSVQFVARDLSPQRSLQGPMSAPALGCRVHSRAHAVTAGLHHHRRPAGLRWASAHVVAPLFFLIEPRVGWRQGRERGGAHSRPLWRQGTHATRLATMAARRVGWVARIRHGRVVGLCGPRRPSRAWPRATTFVVSPRPSLASETPTAGPP